MLQKKIEPPPLTPYKKKPPVAVDRLVNKRRDDLYSTFYTTDAVDHNKWRLIYLNLGIYKSIRGTVLFGWFNVVVFAYIVISGQLPLLATDIITKLPSLSIHYGLTISLGIISYALVVLGSVLLRRMLMIRIYHSLEDPEMYCIIWYNYLLKPQKLIFNKHQVDWKHSKEFKLWTKSGEKVSARRFRSNFESYFDDNYYKLRQLE